MSNSGIRPDDQVVRADPSDRRRAGLSITVVGATGVGPTALAAFDDALCAAGVSNFNLVRLSSVIPPGSTVRCGSDRRGQSGVIDLTDTSTPSGEWGDRLYAVWAFQSAELLGQEAWSGVAWAQSPDDGRGLFVEHEGMSESLVREELNASLTSILGARNLSRLPHRSVVVGTRCEGEPVASLVIAPYQSAPWNLGQEGPVHG